MGTWLRRNSVVGIFRSMQSYHISSAPNPLGTQLFLAKIWSSKAIRGGAHASQDADQGGLAEHRVLTLAAVLVLRKAPHAVLTAAAALFARNAADVCEGSAAALQLNEDVMSVVPGFGLLPRGVVSHQALVRRQRRPRMHLLRRS